MKLIESKVELIEQQPGLEGVYKQVELAGRTCYLSSDKITETSSKEFTERMINSKHLAMCEHATIYLSVPAEDVEVVQFYGLNPYSKVCTDLVEDSQPCHWLITSNLRVLVEHDRMRDLKYLCEPKERHEKRITVRFICDRAVAQEITRHRAMSFAMESQRYVGYDKERFGGEITFVKPHWYAEEFPACLTWIESLKESEKKYLELREAGLKPQDARGVLPNATKTEIVVTGFELDWKHFFSLRAEGTTGAPHPDIKKLALELQEKLNNVNDSNKIN